MILNRQNPMGLRFTLSEHPNVSGKQTEIRMVGTQKRLVVDIPIERVSAMWYQWQMGGKFVQDAFSELNAEQREFLITGITPTEWSEIFKIPNPEHCRYEEICNSTGKCEAIRKYDRSCND